MGARPMSERANAGQCKVCGGARPPGRPVYCSDACFAEGTAQRHRARQARRLSACARCGGPKEVGTRGGKLCVECRRLSGDTQVTLDRERSRRRHLVALAAKAESGARIKSRRLDAPAGKKWCARCQEFRPTSSFPKRKEGGGGFAAYCIPCQRTYNQERRLKIQFGITWDEYEFMLACQDGRCAICGGKPRKYMLAVDHDHKTGEIRGLLCSRCNHKLLGSANDDPARLRKAADYLEAFGPREVFGERKFVPGFDPTEAGDA